MTPVLPNSAPNDMQLGVLRQVDRGQLRNGTILLPSGLLEWRCEIGSHLTEAVHAALARPNTRGGG